MQLAGPIHAIIRAAGTGAPELDQLHRRLLDTRWLERTVTAAVLGDPPEHPR